MIRDLNTRLLTGLPRSGTTLCCHLLNGYPDTVALHEPLEPAEVPEDARQVAAFIEAFAADARRRLIDEGRARSKQKDGGVPANPVGRDDSGRRSEIVTLGDLRVTGTLSEQFILVIKHNALFTALLDRLSECFDVFAVVRNPLPVLASWQSVDLPVGKGSLPMGERFDSKLRATLSNKGDMLDRQLALLSWFFERYRHVDPSRIIRYEEVVESGGRVLDTLCNSSLEIYPQLAAQHKNAGLVESRLDQLAEVLEARPEIYSGFYSPPDVVVQLERMLL